jgi:hypothetical protein
VDAFAASAADTPRNHSSSAPADWRPTIRRLQTGQLSLDDTGELLRTALEGQQARRQWILVNWTHVVEYQEINRTLTTATWGPDPGMLTDLLTGPLTDALSRAIVNGEPWLRVALCAIADGDTITLDEGATAWLESRAAAHADIAGGVTSSLDERWSQLAAGSTESQISTLSIGDEIDL